MRKTFQIIVALVMVYSPPLFAEEITKCQDASGQWHYGDYASQKCAEGAPVSKVLESGVNMEVEDPRERYKKLEEERKQREEERKAKIAREEKARVDSELLKRFPTEGDLIEKRDSQIAQAKTKIEFNERIFNDLKAELDAFPEPKTEREKQEIHDLELRMQRFERAIGEGEFVLEKTISDFEKLLERYRQIE